jgi:hypothetical protein
MKKKNSKIMVSAIKNHNIPKLLRIQDNHQGSNWKLVQFKQSFLKISQFKI